MSELFLCLVWYLLATFALAAHTIASEDGYLWWPGHLPMSVPATSLRAGAETELGENLEASGVLLLMSAVQRIT